jgi:hypothetical protein
MRAVQCARTGRRCRLISVLNISDWREKALYPEYDEVLRAVCWNGERQVCVPSVMHSSPAEGNIRKVGKL